MFLHFYLVSIVLVKKTNLKIEANWFIKNSSHEFDKKLVFLLK